MVKVYHGKRIRHSTRICTPDDQVKLRSGASAWRYGFSQLPANYNDHELFCGGFTRQHRINKGKCGECGDPFDLPSPRPHEFGGKFGKGITVRKYSPGSIVTIRVELTASHMGFFEFRLCEKINAKQQCLDKNVLSLINGSPSNSQPNDLRTRFYPRNGSRIYEIQAQLPRNVECEHCVLQWKYLAGNNWGICENGEGAVGCGEQEEFRACSDVAIGKGAISAIPTIEIPNEVKPPTVLETDPDSEAVDKPSSNVSNFFGVFIAMFTFFLVLCAIAIFYIYFYHSDLLKVALKRPQTSHKTIDEETSPTSPIGYPGITNSSQEILPARPPRTKRISQTFKDAHEVVSITAPKIEA